MAEPETVTVHGREVHGVDVGPETRCAHYDGPRDVVAVRFACCGRYYPCVRCHDAVADHPREVWPRESFDERAALCGACGTEHQISAYLGATACPDCEAGFNPGCRHHYHLYFDVEP